MEECHQQATGQTGLDQHQVLLWHSFHRHTMLSLSALAILAVAATRPAPPAPLAQRRGRPGQRRHPACGLGRHRDPPASPDELPPEDPGQVKVSVPEARRLLRLAITPMTAAARQLGYSWSRWRRRHQARARYHHYQTRLRATPT